MAQVEVLDEHGNPIQLTDPYGNPVWLTDEHGNPVRLTGVVTTTTAEKGVHGGRTTVAELMASEERSDSDTPMHVVDHQTGHHDRVAGQLHRSTSSSSNSSEDDGQGGRRKKGVKGKIKEKVPVPALGGVKKEHSHTVTSTTTTSTGGNHHPEHEKKSIIEKIKEKLPGHHNH